MTDDGNWNGEVFDLISVNCFGDNDSMLIMSTEEENGH